MPVQTFVVNGQTVSLDVNPDVRVLWVLRDLLGITGPKYGCGINVCKACTSHINGRAFNPCSVRVGDIKPNDRIDTIEGLPATVGAELHPMQQAWIDRDVAQCGYCQPGQIMAAVALVKKARRENREINETDLDNIRNICRCGTYVRIRSAIMQGAANMTAEMASNTGNKPASAVAANQATKKKNKKNDGAKAGSAQGGIENTAANSTLPNTGAPNLAPVVAAGVAAVLAGDVLRRKGAKAVGPVTVDGPDASTTDVDPT